MNILHHNAMLLAGLALYVTCPLNASDWIGDAGDNLFSNPANWNGSIPNASNSANFGIPASVEFSESGAASSLNISAPTSFLLNGRTFQAGQTQVNGNISLLIRDGVASLGGVTLEGSLIATGAGSLVSAIYLQGNSSGARVLQFSNGAVFQADSINFFNGGLSMQVQSGAMASVNSFSLNIGQSLTVAGVGSSLTASSGIGGSGSINVSDGGTLTTNVLASSLIASGPGSFVQAASFFGTTIAVSDGATVALGGNSTVTISSISISGNGSSLASALNIEGSATVSSGGKLTANSLNLRGASSFHQAAVTANSLANAGVLDIRNSEVGSTSLGGSLNNSGALTGNFSTNYSLQNGGSIFVGQGESMTFRDGTNNSSITISGGNLDFSQGNFSNGGTIALNGDLRANGGISNSNAIEVSGTGNIWGGNFVNNGSGSVAVFGSSTANFMDDVQNDGTIAIGLGSTAVFYGGLSGGGHITGPGTTVILGDLRPGHSPGIQFVEGNLVFGDTLAFSVEIDGLSQGVDYDAVLVGGLLSVDGSLVISLGDEYVPSVGDSFEVLTFGSRVGDFASYQGLDLGGGLSLAHEWTDSSLILTVVPEPHAAYMVMLSMVSAFLFSRKRNVNGQPTAPTA